MLAAFGLGKLGQQQGQFDVPERREHGDEVVHLEDETDMARAPVGQLAAGHVRDFIAGHTDGAARGNIEAAQQIEQSGLARAARPHEGHKIALIDVKIQALQDVDVLVAAAVGFVQAANLNQAAHCSIAVHTYHDQRSLISAISDQSPEWRHSLRTTAFCVHCSNTKSQSQKDN